MTMSAPTIDSALQAERRGKWEKNNVCQSVKIFSFKEHFLKLYQAVSSIIYLPRHTSLQGRCKTQVLTAHCNPNIVKGLLVGKDS